MRRALALIFVLPVLAAKDFEFPTDATFAKMLASGEPLARSAEASR